MKAPKRKVFTVKCDTYFADVLVVAGGSVGDAQKLWMRKHPHLEAANLSEAGERAGCVFWGPRVQGCCIWFHTHRPGGGLVSHEAFHAVCRILKIAGVSLTDDSEEAFAYLLEFLVRGINQRLC